VRKTDEIAKLRLLILDRRLKCRPTREE